MPGFRIPNPLLNEQVQPSRDRGYGALAVMYPPGGLVLTPVSTADERLLPPGALNIDADGVVQDIRVKQMIFKTIEHGPMARINGIIVHQTGGASAQSAFNSYERVGAHGAHFLIEKRNWLR